MIGPRSFVPMAMRSSSGECRRSTSAVGLSRVIEPVSKNERQYDQHPKRAVHVESVANRGLRPQRKSSMKEGMMVPPACLETHSDVTHRLNRRR